MQFIKPFISWLVALVIFLVLDSLWLGIVARDFYRSRLSNVIDMQVQFPVAAVFYMLHITGVMIFVIQPAAQNGSGLLMLLCRGGLYGLFTYATYDLTNLATVRNWPLSLALTDILWGTVLNAMVALSGFLVWRRFS